MANANPWQARLKAVEACRRSITHPRTGETDSFRGWARRTGLSANAIKHRIDVRNWPIDEALDTPAGARAEGEQT